MWCEFSEEIMEFSGAEDLVDHDPWDGSRCVTLLYKKLPSAERREEIESYIWDKFEYYVNFAEIRYELYGGSDANTYIWLCVDNGGFGVLVYDSDFGNGYVEDSADAFEILWDKFDMDYMPPEYDKTVGEMFKEIFNSTDEEIKEYIEAIERKAAEFL